MSIEGYGKYTDDFYAILDSCEELKFLLDDLRIITQEFGIILKEHKTQIVELPVFYRYVQNG